MSTRHADDDIVVCAICGVQADGQQYFMVRESWIRAGGFGSIPDEAIVHVRCDESYAGEIVMSRGCQAHYTPS
jgi:predicted transcriptional regulator